MKNKTLVAIVLAVLIIGGTVAAVIGQRPDESAAAGSSMTGMGDMSSMDMSPMPHASHSAAVETTNVEIDDYAFSPQVIRVKVGQPVIWTNKDSVQHNIMADKTSGDAPNGPLISRNATYSFTFTTAGTYTYHCMPHPYMKATVIVE